MLYYIMQYLTLLPTLFVPIFKIFLACEHFLLPSLLQLPSMTQATIIFSLDYCSILLTNLPESTLAPNQAIKASLLNMSKYIISLLPQSKSL